MNTELENRMEDWFQDHLGCCGTCEYNKRRYCTAIRSEAYGEEVEDKCGCQEWTAEKGLHV